ncbi:MAG: hypothetical protein VX237_06525 [Chloroflexota bacterium]|nr:hypothetical protein [Chloroflexota bacterium]
MINLLKSKNALVILVILIVIVIGMSSMTGNRFFDDIVALVRGDEIVHVSDMNGGTGAKDTAIDDVEIDRAEQDDEAVTADMNNAIQCLDQAYSAFYNPFIQSHQAYEELILPLWDESISDEDRLDRLAKAKYAAQALQSQLLRVSPPNCLSSITDSSLRNMGAEVLTNLDFIKFEEDLEDWYTKALNYLQSSSDCFDSMIAYEGSETLDDSVESTCEPMMSDLDQYYGAVANIDKFSERVRLEMEE